MTTRSKTVRSEIDLVTFMNDSRVGPRAGDVYRNSSGMPTLVYEDGVPAVLWEVGIGTNEIAVAANFAAATSVSTFVSGLLGFERVLVEVDLPSVTALATELHIAPRWSNELTPDPGGLGAAVDHPTWAQQLEAISGGGGFTFSKTGVYQLETSVNTLVAGKTAFEIPALGNHLSLVLWTTGANQAVAGSTVSVLPLR